MTGAEDRSRVRPVGRGEAVSEAVVLAVLAASGRPTDPVDHAALRELDALSATLDPDALDSLFGNRFDGRLEFDWAGYSVVVDRGTRVVVTPRE